MRQLNSRTLWLMNACKHIRSTNLATAVSGQSNVKWPFNRQKRESMRLKKKKKYCKELFVTLMLTSCKSCYGVSTRNSSSELCAVVGMFFWNAFSLHYSMQQFVVTLCDCRLKELLVSQWEKYLCFSGKVIKWTSTEQFFKKINK